MNGTQSERQTDRHINFQATLAKRNLMIVCLRFYLYEGKYVRVCKEYIYKNVLVSKMSQQVPAQVLCTC